MWYANPEQAAHFAAEQRDSLIAQAEQDRLLRGLPRPARLHSQWDALLERFGGLLIVAGQRLQRRADNLRSRNSALTVSISHQR